MKEVTRLFSDLKNISGNIAKADFIKTNINNKTFMNSLKFLIRTDNPTGISTKKYDKWEDSDSMFIDESKNPPKETTLEDIFSYLEVHNSGRDEDIRYIRTFGNVWCEDEEDEEFYKRIICKDYPIGVDAKSLNKIIPNFIPTFDVGLCDKYYDNEKVIDGTVEYLIDTKTDGCRCVALKENGNVKLVSRGGKRWFGMTEIEQAIKDLPQDNIVFDSEITIKNPQNYPSLEVYDRTIKIVTTKSEEKLGLQLNCFDYMTLEEWNNKKSNFGCLDRKNQLYDIIKGNDVLVFVENLYVGKDPNIIEELMNTIVEDNDMEGLVCKVANSPYQWKRTKNWLKVKKMQRSDSDGKEVDATIVGYYEGKNKNKGKLGGLYCTMEHPIYGHLEFKCGGGFSDYMREYLFGLGDKLIGRTISVQYFESSKNSKTNIQSLRFPVFLELKEEGQEPNN